MDNDVDNCFRLYETFDEGNDYFIVTELVEGGELFDRIVSKSHYTEKESRDLILIFLKTVEYIHSQGIVHRLNSKFLILVIIVSNENTDRDLKPENLLLRSRK